MATTKKIALRPTKPAPAAKLATPTPPAQSAPLPSESLTNRLAFVKANASKIQSFQKDAREAGEKGGFEPAVAASAAVGFDWDDAILWVQNPLGGIAPASEQELLIREIHAMSDPISMPAVVTAKKERLQHVINLSDPDVIEEARVKTRIVTSQADPLTPEVKAAAKKALADERKLYADQGDTAGVATVDQYLAAKSDVGRLWELANDINKSVTAYGRFRASLFLHLIEETFKEVIPSNEYGREYLTASGKAIAAHKAYMASHDGQSRKIDELKEAVLGAVRAYGRSKFDVAQKKAPLQGDERRIAAANAIYTAIRRALRCDAITEDQAEGMRQYLRDELEENAVTTEAGEQTGAFLTYEDMSAPKKKAKKETAKKTPRTGKGKKRAAAPKAKAAPTPAAAPALPKPAPVTRARVTAPPVPGKATVAKSAGNAAKLISEL